MKQKRKRLRTKRETQVTSVFKELETLKQELAALRDKYRDRLSEMEDVLYTIENATEDVETALRLLRDAEATMSMYV